MAFDSAAVTAITQALVSAAQKLALFEHVNGHEPRAAPATGLSMGIWMGPFGPLPRVSGLAATSVRAEFQARIYLSAEQHPLDGIDPRVTGAAAQFFSTLSGGFTLGGQVMEVDLLGAYGAPLSGTPGYISHDSKFFRVMNLVIPVIVDGTFGQAP